MTWEIFKKAFLDRFVHRELREAKVEEFTNHWQGGMSAFDYSLKFTKLSKYAPSLVSNPRDEMSRFLTGVSEDLVEESRSAMLHNNVNICHLMVHAQQVEETWLCNKSRNAKMAMSYEGGSSKDMLECKENLGSRRGFQIKFLRNFPRLVMIGCLT